MLTKSNLHETDPLALDTAMMERCIRLSATAAASGELPFAAVVCEDDRIVVEATNLVAQTADVTRHAELIAVSEAQKTLGRKDLSSCALYSNVEPSVMCSFPIRETGISRVIYAIGSPMMGGFSKWNVLRDAEISDAMPEAFGGIPEVIAGLCRDEAEKVWSTWNPIVWAVIKHRGCFAQDTEAVGIEHLEPVQQRGSLLRKLLKLHHNCIAAKAAARRRNASY